MSNTQVYRDWAAAIWKGEKPANTAVTAVVSAEFWVLYNKTSEYIRHFSTKGVPAKMSGTGDIRKNGFQLRAGGQTFTINPPSAKPAPKGVQDTSRAAYASLDKGAQVETVAKAVIDLHRAFPFVTDSLVADRTAIPAGRVSARRNEIEAYGAVMVNSELHHFEQASQKIKCPITGKSVNGWALRRSATLF